MDNDLREATVDHGVTGRTSFLSRRELQTSLDEALESVEALTPAAIAYLSSLGCVKYLPGVWLRERLYARHGDDARSSTTADSAESPGHLALTITMSSTSPSGNRPRLRSIGARARIRGPRAPRWRAVIRTS